MKYFPIFVDLEGRPVLVAGGGEAAAQKLRLILKTDAQITVFASQACREINELALAGRLKIEQRPPTGDDLIGAALIYAAAEDNVEDARVAALATEAGVPINVVDNPGLSNFITPAIVDRDPVTIAIGTEGTAPVLARTIKAQIEAMLPRSTGAIAILAANWRDRIAARIAAPRARRTIWQRFFAAGLPKTDTREAIATAELRLQALVGAAEIAEASQSDPEQRQALRSGTVSVVDASRRSSGEVSAKARHRLFAADIVIFDRDCAPSIRELVRREAVFHRSDEISLAEMIEREAKLGHQIVYLNGASQAEAALHNQLVSLANAGIEIEYFDTEPKVANAPETAATPAFVPLAGHHIEAPQNPARAGALQ